MFCANVLCIILVSVQSFQYAAAGTAKRNVNDDLPIKYPGPSVSNTYSNQNTPDKCRGKTYCTVRPEDYPEEKFNEMFKGFKGAPPSPSIVIEEPSIVNRQGDPDEKDNCESVVTYEPLYKVRTSPESDWRMVVQAPKADYVQRVRLESCTQEEASCFTIFPPQNAYITFCKQKYNTWEVLVDDGKGGTEKIKAELPVCCSCHYKPTSIFSRFGKPNKH